MGRKRINGQYWTAIEDDLMHQYFFTGSTKMQKVKAINAVYPKMQQMARVILTRYYYKFHSAWDIIDDAIAHFLLNCHFDESKGSYFSYLGTSFKHYFHDIYVVHPNHLHIDIDNNYDISTSENDWVMDKHAVQADFEEFDFTERQLKLSKIIAYIQTHIDVVDGKIDRYKGFRTNPKLAYYHRALYEKEFLQGSIQYFKDYFLTSEVSNNSLNDYLISHTNMPAHLFQRLSYHYFRIGGNTEYIDKRSAKMDSRRVKQGMSYIMDDYTPVEDMKLYIKYNKRYNKYSKDNSYF
mgnify:CR=1 FL=1